jgi:hypothetical protein
VPKLDFGAMQWVGLSTTKSPENPNEICCSEQCFIAKMHYCASEIRFRSITYKRDLNNKSGVQRWIDTEMAAF